MGNSKDNSGRLLSLDALRGLDMFFLVGLGGIFRALPKLSDTPLNNWLALQCKHPAWLGFTAWDLIFPMFIFIVGVAMPFSFSKRLQQEGGKKELFKHVLIRAIILTILGAVLNEKPWGADPQYGYYSVLYRIGFSYFFAALIMMNTNIRGQASWAFGLLIGYWMLIRFVPVPGYGAGDYSQEGNLVTYVSNQVSDLISPNFRYVLMLTMITSVSNALLGVLAGHWLMSARKPNEKTIGLLLAGIGLVVAGLLVHLDFPISKEFGTTSFTLLTCGISALFLCLFYWLIDVKGYKKGAFFFVVVGMNSITIYVAESLVKFGSVANVFVGGIDFGRATALMYAIAVAAIEWLFLYYLYRNKIFLKI
jgi:predicted acyltransferase